MSLAHLRRLARALRSRRWFFAPAVVGARRCGGRGWSRIPGLIALGYTLRLMRQRAEIPRNHGKEQRWSRPAAVRQAARAALHRRRAAHADAKSLSMFLPVLLTRAGDGRQRGQRRGVALSVRQHASAASSAGRWPIAMAPRRVIIWSLVAAVPFLLAAQLTSGWTLTAAGSIGGFLLQSTLPVNVTFGQQIAPVSAATVSSLMMGFAWGVGRAAGAGCRAARRHARAERRAARSPRSSRCWRRWSRCRSRRERSRRSPTCGARAPRTASNAEAGAVVVTLVVPSCRDGPLPAILRRHATPSARARSRPRSRS